MGLLNRWRAHRKVERIAYLKKEIGTLKRILPKRIKDAELCERYARSYRKSIENVQEEIAQMEKELKELYDAFKREKSS